MIATAGWPGRVSVSLFDRLPGRLAARLTSTSTVARVARPFVNRLVPSGLAEVTVASGPGSGLRLEIDPRSEKFYWTGTHETHLQDLLRSVLRQGDVFWDVGAHIGFFSAIAARLVGPAGQVHAFEPLPENARRLASAVAANGLQNVEVHECAVAETSGRRRLECVASSSMGRLAPPTGHRGPEVACRSLDDLADELGPPSVLKIDVEGSELAVLAGGERLLSTARPLVVVECHTAEAAELARARFPGATMAHVGGPHWTLSWT